MSWARLDDQFFTHPKVIDLSKDAKLLFLAGLTYCAAQLTDGAISAGALRVIAATVDVDRACAGELVGVGLWEEAGGGYQVHDYLEYQPTRERAMATKQARAEAGSKGGHKSAESRAEAKSQANNEANAEQIAEQNGKPISTPSHPIPEEEYANAYALAAPLAPVPVKPAVTRKGGPEERRNSRCQDALGVFIVCYKTRYGERPVIPDQDTRSFKGILEQVPPGEEEPAIHRFFACENELIVRGRHSLRKFMHEIGTWFSDASVAKCYPPPGRGRASPSQPAEQFEPQMTGAQYFEWAAKNGATPTGGNQ